jgi:hypothetical protein
MLDWARPEGGMSCLEETGREVYLMTKRTLFLAGWLALLAGVALLAGCGGPAEAGPLEVTYYYMPG